MMSGVGSRGAARVDQVRRDGHVAAAIASIEEKFGNGAIQRLGATPTSDVQVIPIGLAELDRIVGVGGLPRGRIVEVLGPESAGVSTLLLHAVAAAQHRGGIAALIDVDRGFDPEYARRIGLDLSSLFIAQPDDGAMALEIVDALVRSTAFDLVAVDSVAALEPPDQTDTVAISSRGARQGRLLSEALRRLAAGVDRTRTVLLFGNRTIPAADDDLAGQTSGGRALPFYASVRLGLRRRELIRETIGIVGTQVEATTIKNKVAPPLRVATLDLMFGKGFVQDQAG
jgi:recombination protein RecA